MKTILILLAVSFLASCTMMERAGIEKRRYSAGYYIPPLFAKSKAVQKSSDMGRDDKMEAITPLPYQPNTGNELATIDESARPVSDQASDAADYSQAKVNNKLISLLNKFSPKVIQDYAAKRSTLEFTDRKSLLYRGCGHGCGSLFGAAILILLILCMLAATPAAMTPLIIFAACGVVLLILLISLLIRESIRAAHREEWHDHMH
jgi:hypothetical protein